MPAQIHATFAGHSRSEMETGGSACSLAGFRRSSMLPFSKGCPDYFRSSRRELLRVGALGAFGLSTADLFRARTAAAALPVDDLSCIVLWLDGGPPAMDLWDLKPDAPSETRGEFRPIGTNVPGIQICEHLPKVAKLMDRIALVRSFHHPFGCHDTGPTMMQSGFIPLKRGAGGIDVPIGDFPGYGSALAAVKGRRGLLPAHVAIPRPPYGAGPGYMGPRYNPFAVLGDPNSPSFTVRDLNAPKGVTALRTDRRRSLLSAVDEHFRQTDEELEFRLVDRFYQEAYDLNSSPKGRIAFDLKQEPDSVRDDYGRTKIGQGCLLARRLVEAGVRFVTVNDGGWDTHAKNFTQLKSTLLPGLDRAFSTLLTDLQQRGMLEKTLVLCMGDFSRTPTINPDAGRDHWANCISVTLAGGGIRGGTVVGASDRTCAYPTEEAMETARLAATVYHLLGIPPDTVLEDMSGRRQLLLPKPVEPIAALL